MKFTTTPFVGLVIIEAEPFCDARGSFARIFCEKELSGIGLNKRIVQINHSVNVKAGTVRGMHYQKPPMAEIKIVKCLKGKVFDVVIDVRQGSPTFRQWYGFELSAEKRNMVFIPEGFAHGFQTLEDNCELLYLHTQFYSSGHEAAIRHDDPLVGIRWPRPVSELSERDKSYPYLTDDFRGVAV